MPKQISPSNSWCFTLNNYTEDDLKFLSSKFSEESEKYFFIYGKEVAPTSGTPHLQGYIKSKRKDKNGKPQKWRPFTEFAAIKRAHWSRAKGTMQQNYIYCSKEGDFKTNITPVSEADKRSLEERVREEVRVLRNRIWCFEVDLEALKRQVTVENEEHYDLYAELAAPILEKEEPLLERLMHLEEVYPPKWCE